MINKNERKLVGVAVVVTVIVTFGLTASQGSISLGKKQYVAHIDVEEELLTQDDYNVISKEIVDENKLVYKIVSNMNLSSEQIVYLGSKLEEENYENTYDELVMYIFEDEEKANKFDYEASNIEIEAIVRSGNIEINTYNFIDKEITEDIVSDYEVISVEEVSGTTKIELKLGNDLDPAKALYNIKVVGQYIKDSNPESESIYIDVNAQEFDNENIIWKYTSGNKNLVIKTEIFTIS